MVSSHGNSLIKGAASAEAAGQVRDDAVGE
jgi:hypothetical protein